MARFKYYRYSTKDATRFNVRLNGFVRVEDNGDTAVYMRPLTCHEIEKTGLKELGCGNVYNIKRLRLFKGFTQEDLSNIAGIPKNAVQRYELYGTGTCPLKYAQRLAAALDCSVSDLLDDVEEMHVKSITHV